MKAIPAVLLLVLMSHPAAASFDDAVAHVDYVPGQLSVAMASGEPGDLDDVTALLGSVLAADIVSVDYLFEPPEKMDEAALGLGLGRFLLITVEESVDHLTLIDELTRLPAVESADLNWTLELQWTPNDSLFPEQWAMDNTGQQPGHEPDIDMDAPAAWDITKGASSVVIAILDSGINYNHEDLAGQLWTNEDEALDGEDTDGNGYVDDVMGWDFVHTTDPECQDPDCLEADNDPLDGSGHGTWVSGIAAAATDNERGVAGVCPECRLMPLRVFHDDGAVGGCEVLRVVDAAYYAVANGADVLNMSFGNAGHSGSCYSSTAFDAVLDYAHESGVVVVAGAGNGGDDRRTHPACYPSVIGVAGHDPDGAKSSSSNYGGWVDVAAPGAYCQTTSLGEGEYGIRSGTSIACPQVAGLAGLLLSATPDLTPDEVRQIIMDTSIPVDWPATPIAAGRVNAYNALVTTGVDHGEAVRLTARLYGNYPNPFNPSTVIEYELPQAARVSLVIYNLSGRRVCEPIADRTQRAGVHSVPWNGCDDGGRPVASGVYFYRLVAGGETLTKKMILLK